MPDVNHWPSRTATKAASTIRRNFLLDEWDDVADEMHAIERAALAYLNALDALRRSSYSAAAVKRIDDHASDFAGSALDLLSNTHGDARTKLDEEGIAPESIAYDDGILRAEYETWNKRAEARR